MWLQPRAGSQGTPDRPDDDGGVAGPPRDGRGREERAEPRGRGAGFVLAPFPFCSVAATNIIVFLYISDRLETEKLGVFHRPLSWLFHELSVYFRLFFF